jgi:haloalkane dehalogenase
LHFIELAQSPLAGNQNTQIYYRESGQGMPLIFLHGGWGYEIYPFDKQIEAFKEQFRILIPDRSGYGRSSRIASMSADFHQQAAEEMLLYLDALRIDRAFLWGHSDGAVIAVKMALAQPSRFNGIILEAFHFYRVKPASRQFFETMGQNPMNLGERVIEVLIRDHGEADWLQIIEMNGAAWLEIAETSPAPKSDLYGGKLSELTTNTILLHGKQDPRTEPDELAAVQRQLPTTPIHLIEEGKHSPHSERLAASETIRLANQFFKMR